MFRNHSLADEFICYIKNIPTNFFLMIKKCIFKINQYYKHKISTGNYLWNSQESNYYLREKKSNCKIVIVFEINIVYMKPPWKKCLLLNVSKDQSEKAKLLFSRGMKRPRSSLPQVTIDSNTQWRGKNILTHKTVSSFLIIYDLRAP